MLLSRCNSRFIFTTLEPLLKPIMSQATTALQTGSAQVINNNDQVSQSLIDTVFVRHYR